jgi:hypothetical protein
MKYNTTAQMHNSNIPAYSEHNSLIGRNGSKKKLPLLQIINQDDIYISNVNKPIIVVTAYQRQAVDFSTPSLVAGTTTKTSKPTHFYHGITVVMTL